MNIYKFNKINFDYFIVHSSHSKAHKWAENLCYILIVIFNLSSWIDLNSVWIELPLIVNNVPERWTLPSTLSLVISLANIFPILVVILHWKLGKRFSEIPFIYIIIIVGIIACFSIGLFWKYTIYIYGKERSFPLIFSVFTLAILDCTSSLVFCDYMKRFKAKYLQAMFFGESLTATLPTLIALAQGIGGEIQCIENNQTLSIEPIYSEARFSVSIFFFLITSIIVVSLIAFMILRLTSVVKLAKAKDRISRKNNIETCEMLLNNSENISKSRKISLSTPNSMTKKEFYILQLFNVTNSAILFGCLPTLITYSLLPYGQKAFYYCNLLFPISYPLSVVFSIIRPTLSTCWIIIGSLFGCLICFFIIIIAFQSPCPIWADTLHGGIIMTVAWFISSFILAYVRVASGNRIKLAWTKENGLFYFGLSVQMGMIFGVVPMYLIINVYGLLKDRQPCVTYCL
jgi:riboflavin transporter 2